jgi:hypothetical protein
MLAEGALLELLPPDELHEHLIILVCGIAYLVLLARLAFVEYDSAIQAVVLLALRALEFNISLFEDKSILTVG